MKNDSSIVEERLALLRRSGVAITAADEKRVGDSVAASLKALASAVDGSLFDTEPQSFDTTMRKLAAGGSK
jgi:hypothetical protein